MSPREVEVALLVARPDESTDCRTAGDLKWTADNHVASILRKLDPTTARKSRAGSPREWLRTSIEQHHPRRRARTRERDLLVALAAGDHLRLAPIGESKIG
jgi:hypothetical protein